MPEPQQMNEQYLAWVLVQTGGDKAGTRSA